MRRIQVVGPGVITGIVTVGYLINELPGVIDWFYPPLPALPALPPVPQRKLLTGSSCPDEQKDFLQRQVNRACKTPNNEARELGALGEPVT